LKAIKKNEPLRIAAQTVHGDRVERIFDIGSVAKGYNRTDELWVADENLRRAGSHRGKTGKTTYFKSYYDLKQQQGFNPNEVNMRLKNDLQMDFANASIDAGTGKADAGEVIFINNNLYIEALRRPKNVDKLNGLIEKYGNFVAVTAAERKKFLKINKLEMLNMLSK
jgi:hypothetical protein